MSSCVRDDIQVNTNTTLQKEVTKALRPKINRLKNRNCLKTLGFNLFGGKRSIYTISIKKEGIQVNILLNGPSRPVSTKIFSSNLNERVMVKKFQQQIKRNDRIKIKEWITLDH
jgi:hypothetical protein